MAYIIAANNEPVTVHIFKTVTLKDGTPATGQVIGAETGKLKDAGVWYVTEILRDDQGVEHRARLMGSSFSLRAFERKPYMIRFTSEEAAEKAAETIRLIARAYLDERIAWAAIDRPEGTKTYRVGLEGTDEAVYDLTYKLPEARETAETLAVQHPYLKVRVIEVPRIIPMAPFGQFLDFDDVKAWIKANVAVGMLLVLEETQGHICTYKPVKVTGIDRRTGKFTVDMPDGAYAMRGIFYVSGKSYDAPTGQSRVLPPLREIVEAAVERRHWFEGKLSSWQEHDTEKTAALRAELAAQGGYDWTWVLPERLGGPKPLAPAAKPRRGSQEATINALHRQGIDVQILDPAPADGVSQNDVGAGGEDEGGEGEERLVARSVVQIRGSHKQAHWAQSIIRAFRKARGLDEPGSVPTADDDAVLGCASASVLIDHEALLKAGDAAGFVAALGVQWLDFTGIDDYRASPTERLRSSSGKGSASALYWHSVTIGGASYGFEAMGSPQWIYKGDRGRFAWYEKNGRRCLLEGTLRTSDDSGEGVIRGKRLAKRTPRHR